MTRAARGRRSIDAVNEGAVITLEASADSLRHWRCPPPSMFCAGDGRGKPPQQIYMAVGLARGKGRSYTSLQDPLQESTARSRSPRASREWCCGSYLPSSIRFKVSGIRTLRRQGSSVLTRRMMWRAGGGAKYLDGDAARRGSGGWPTRRRIRGSRYSWRRFD